MYIVSPTAGGPAGLSQAPGFTPPSNTPPPPPDGLTGRTRRQYVFVAATMPAITKGDPGTSLRKAYPDAVWLAGAHGCALCIPPATGASSLETATAPGYDQRGMAGTAGLAARPVTVACMPNNACACVPGRTRHQAAQGMP